MLISNLNIFKLLFDIIPESIIIVDEDQIIVASNLSAEKMFGYKNGALINQNLALLIPSRYHYNHKTHFADFIKNENIQKINYDLNSYGITKNNKEFPVEVGLNPFSFDHKKYVLALIMDITYRKEAEKKVKTLHADLEREIEHRTAELKNTIKQLKKVNLNYKAEIKKRIEAENKLKAALQKEIELNELKTKFLSMVSHEFKTPLSGILTSSMLLKKYTLDEQQDKRDKHIDTITKKIHYLNNILNDFLSIEMLDSSNVKYKFTTFNLSKVIDEVVYNANMLLKSGQSIIVSPNIENYQLYQDEKILELILSNLLYNSIKYSKEDTTINLDVSQNTKNIIFKLTDEGIGIPEKDQKHIFNRYFRAENVLNTQGTGIGLNIVKNHLENLKGTINFTSKENSGSVFIIELPINIAL